MYAHVVCFFSLYTMHIYYNMEHACLSRPSLSSYIDTLVPIYSGMCMYNVLSYKPDTMHLQL